jgi:hypothetical protein
MKIRYFESSNLFIDKLAILTLDIAILFWRTQDQL